MCKHGNHGECKECDQEEFYEAWWYLNEHPIFNICPLFLHDKTFKFSYFEESLSIDVVKVNPENLTIEDDETKNIKVQIWLECGEPFIEKESGDIHTYHNMDYDTGGDTFEEAIINLAEIIKLKIKEDDNG